MQHHSPLAAADLVELYVTIIVDGWHSDYAMQDIFLCPKRNSQSQVTQRSLNSTLVH